MNGVRAARLSHHSDSEAPRQKAAAPNRRQNFAVELTLGGPCGNRRQIRARLSRDRHPAHSIGVPAIRLDTGVTGR